ncbi:hypothetical protein ACFQ1I_43740 [Kitasatospora arboriphila]
MTASQPPTAPPGRRTLLRAALPTGAAVITGTHPTACSAARTAPATSPTPRTGTGPAKAVTVLLTYFSRPGENYFNGGRTTLAVGNTELLARRIAERTGCDVHRVEAADPYPDSYDETVRRNVREQDSNARPALAAHCPTSPATRRYCWPAPSGTSTPP